MTITLCIIHSFLSSAATSYTKPLQQIRNQGIIEPLPSQLEEVYTRYLGVLEEGKLYIVQGE